MFLAKMTKKIKRKVESESDKGKEEPKIKKKKVTDNSQKNDTKIVKKTKNFVGKSKTDKSKGKQKNFKSSKPTEKPADWAQFKKEKKALKIARKKSKTLYEVALEAKKISEKLRRKTLEGGAEERKKLTEQLHQILGNKGQYVKLVMAHDMARVVQYLLKFGTPKIREEVAKELIPSTIELIQSKYAKFTIEKMLKYGNSTTRAAVIDAFYGHVIKLASHSISAHVLAHAYTTWATNQQKQYLQQEFYGDMYKQSKDSTVHRIGDAYKNSPDMRTAILGAVKANLIRILNKELLDNQLVHAVLDDYLTEQDNQNERNEMITLLSKHAVVLANTKEGARVVMKCIWQGTNKDRKLILKAFKEHIKDLCCHEHAHTVVITIFDAIDDTVLVNKILLSDIVANAQILVQNEWGRKVLSWLTTPGDAHYFHPTFITELKKGYESGTSKKSPEIRRHELLKSIVSPLLKDVANNAEKWLENNSVAMVTLSIVKAGTESPEDLRVAFQEICKHISDPDWRVKEKQNDEVQEVVGVEQAGVHMVLKKMIQNDKLLLENPEFNFTLGSILLDTLSDETIEKWMSKNRGCFLLVAVYESNSETVRKKLLDIIKKYKKLLKQQTTPGAKILLKKLKD